MIERVKFDFVPWLTAGHIGRCAGEQIQFGDSWANQCHVARVPRIEQGEFDSIRHGVGLRLAEGYPGVDSPFHVIDLCMLEVDPAVVDLDESAVRITHETVGKCRFHCGGGRGQGAYGVADTTFLKMSEKFCFLTGCQSKPTLSLKRLPKSDTESRDALKVPEISPKAGRKPRSRLAIGTLALTLALRTVLTRSLVVRAAPGSASRVSKP